MKKKIIFLLTIIVLTIFGILIKTIFNKEKSSFQDDSSEQIKEENLLSMMLETSAGSGEYEMVTQSSWPTDGYTFNATLSKCENGGELGWDSTYNRVTMTGNMADKCYVYFDIIPLVSDFCSNGDYLATCLTNYADNVDSSITNIYHHDGTLANGINDGSYRYAGSYNYYTNYNNYVCFGTNVETCPDDNLYRIIGVIDGKIKLVKQTSLGEMAWDSAGANAWSTSSLNTYLNGTYLTSLSETWSSKIVTTTWKTGVVTSSTVAAEMYINEMSNATSGSDGLTEYSSKIALMYDHDFQLALAPYYWQDTILALGNGGNLAACPDVCWVISQSEFSTLPDTLPDPLTDTVSYVTAAIRATDNVYIALLPGTIIYYNTSTCSVHPSFFLDSTISYKSGTGTFDDPIKIN